MLRWRRETRVATDKRNGQVEGREKVVVTRPARRPVHSHRDGSKSSINVEVPNGDGLGCTRRRWGGERKARNERGKVRGWVVSPGKHGERSGKPDQTRKRKTQDPNPNASSHRRRGRRGRRRDRRKGQTSTRKKKKRKKPAHRQYRRRGPTPGARTPP